MKINKKDYRFELRLSEESRKALSELSNKQNRSKANVVETLILKEYEKYKEATK